MRWDEMRWDGKGGGWRRGRGGWEWEGWSGGWVGGDLGCLYGGVDGWMDGWMDGLVAWFGPRGAP